MMYYRVPVSWTVLMLPLFLVLTLAVGLGVSLWLGALYVRYRDVAQVVPFLTQIWFYATPIAYAISLVPEGWRLLYGLNPMVGVIEGFRWSLLGQSSGGGLIFLASVMIAAVLLVTGIAYFQRVEDTSQT